MNYLVFLQASKFAAFVMPELAEVEVESLPTTVIDHTDPPIFNPDVNYTDLLKVKLLQTGAYHSDEVPYKTGDRWLGLFREGNSYELRWTKIQNRAIDDPIVTREILTSTKQSSVFLLRGATNLEPGPIYTVFDSENGDAYSLVDRHSFGIGGQFWKLWIENADANGYPQEESLAREIFQHAFPARLQRTLFSQR